ncbi:MAG: hypothetical protein WC856_02370 [Methylococcaceae bacterium]|jgi:hypothetical protein
MELKEDYVYSELIDGEIELSIAVIYDGLDENVNEVMEYLLYETSDTTTMEVTFKIENIIDTAIDGHELCHNPGYIDMDSKHLFDAIKRQFQEQIDRIDELQFFEVKQ